MTGTLVDSNVILDVATEDPEWFRWSSGTFAGLRLLTRDARRYETYFPSVDLVHPGGTEH